MELNDIKCSNCIFKSNVASVLSDDELGILEKGCSKNQFNKGELIFKESSPTEYITYIRSGLIKLCKAGSGGKNFILSIAKKGAYLGIQNLNRQHKKNYSSAIAITSSDVCFIKIDSFTDLLKLNSNFALELISYILDDEMNYFDRLVNNIQQQLPGRLASVLLYFSKQIYNSNSFNLNLTKAELASLIGTSRESVSRILKDFQNSEIIRLDRNTIEILNENKLNEIKLKG